MADRHCCASIALAKDIPIAEQTTRTYIGRILAKLNLRDRAQAVVVAHETRQADKRRREFRLVAIRAVYTDEEQGTVIVVWDGRA